MKTTRLATLEKNGLSRYLTKEEILRFDNRAIVVQKKLIRAIIKYFKKKGKEWKKI